MSDLDGTALRTDPKLINPWGIVPFPNSRFRVSDNGTGVTGQGSDNAVFAPLNSAWGLAPAPHGLGALSHDLPAGDFGDGQINVFDPRTGTFAGALQQPSGQPVSIEGLWGPFFRPDPSDPSHPLLFFTAGTRGEQHGLFSRLRAAGG